MLETVIMNYGEYVRSKVSEQRDWWGGGSVQRSYKVRSRREIREFEAVESSTDLQIL